MKKNTKTAPINELETWLKKNSPIKMAIKLGYKSPATIEAWIRRKSIPSYQLPHVLKIIRK